MASPPAIKPRTRVRAWMLLGPGALAALLIIGIIAERIALERLQVESRARLATWQESIDASADRLRHLPLAVAQHPGVVDQLRGLDDAAEINNAYLASLAQAANASLLYVLDTDGLTIASSNHAEAGSLVGNRYSFRPYFQQALTGDEARYFGVGVTTGEAGYYFAQAIRDGGRIIGVAVVKSELESLQRLWRDAGESLLLLDEYGVSILASEPTWRFRASRALDTQQLEQIRNNKKYAGRPLTQLSPDMPATGAELPIDGNDWIASRTRLTRQNWQLLYLVPGSRLDRAVIQTIALSVLVMGLGLIAGLYLRERRRRSRLALAQREAARMRTLNHQLELEIGTRKRAENDLLTAQQELIQASKLAALGQMSAAVAHEVNQPLSAIRTFSASARLLLGKRRFEEVDGNLQQIDQLTTRLASMTQELKVFSRKADPSDAGTAEAVSIQRALAQVQSVLRPRLEQEAVSFSMNLPDDQTLVTGSAVKLEQVLSNLAQNAIDATAENANARTLNVSVTLEGDQVVLRMRDNGPGLNDDQLQHLFDPFFTTKPVGKGVGLGLAIAYGIVQEMGGSLRVRNREDGGALFTLRLPRYQS